MGHHTARSGYQALVERLNRFPQGAPPTETLYQLLSILFSEEEAALVAKLPIQGFDAGEAAKRWQLPMVEATAVLDRLASRALLVDYEKDGIKHYVLPPPMAGWIEFSMMRLRTDVDQHTLGQLLHQYMNVEEDFVRALFFESETKIVRAFVNEAALEQSGLGTRRDDAAPLNHDHSHDLDHGHTMPHQAMEILDYQRATKVIEGAEHIGLSMCYCRHKMDHMGKACDAPMDICMTFGKTADSLIRANYATAITKERCLELLEEAYQHNLVQIGENVQNEVAFICNCCGCCCEALLAAKRFGTAQTIATTAFLPSLDADKCVKCGKCQRACPLDALGTDKLPQLDVDMCLGCGVCVRTCPVDALKLEHVGQRKFTPVNSAHRVVLMALEKGTLSELIFDNKDLWSHRLLAGILTAILELPPAKRLLANEQLQSKYLLTLIERFSRKPSAQSAR